MTPTLVVLIGLLIQSPSADVVTPLQPFSIHPPQDAVELQTVPENLQQLLSGLVREALPREYENKKDWGHQKKTWDGVHLKMDGLKLKTKRKWKQANHGTWKRYSINMIDPEQTLSVKLRDFKKHQDGTTGFSVMLGSKLDCYGQLQRWNRGIKVFSISADARADVEVGLVCEVSTTMDLSHLPPEILFHPKVTSAEVRLRDLTLDRLSHADGPLVQELGDALERFLRKELNERNQKLVDKMNRQIRKKEEKLRLSLQDCLEYEWLKPSDS